MKFLVESSKILPEFQIDGNEKIVKFVCKNCELRNMPEILSYDCELGLFHHYQYGSLQYEYVRVIFGIHPEIIKKAKHIPVRQSSLYFCYECESALLIFDNLLSVVKEVAGPEFFEGMDIPELVPEKGTWITANRFGEKEANFNLQISLNTLNEIFKGLIEKFPTNPFRIIDLES